MTRVKICGLTNEHDATAAAELGAFAVGFIFAPSPRRITPERAAAIIRGLPAGVLKVGVFVNSSPAEVERVTGLTGIDLVQLHGEEGPEWADLFPGRIIKAFSSGLPREWQGKAWGFLMDAAAPGQRGGMGLKADWDRAAVYAREVPLILAGGLTAENVAEAIKKVRPVMVDVSSGVEESPGKKEPVKLRSFFSAVKEADRNGELSG